VPHPALGADIGGDGGENWLKCIISTQDSVCGGDNPKFLTDIRDFRGLVAH